ncbi:hypothetical protein D9M68_969530 [compost metagenome]
MLGAISLVRFDQGDQLAENLADVAPIDLVDHHRESLIRCRSCPTTQFFEDARADLILNFASLCVAVENRPEPLDELLVTVGLVEGDKAVALDLT